MAMKDKISAWRGPPRLAELLSDKQRLDVVMVKAVPIAAFMLVAGRSICFARVSWLGRGVPMICGR